MNIRYPIYEGVYRILTFFVSHVIDFLHDMLLIACALWNQLPVLRFSLASTEMMYPPLLFTLLQFVPLNIFQT